MSSDFYENQIISRYKAPKLTKFLKNYIKRSYENMTSCWFLFRQTWFY